MNENQRDHNHARLGEHNGGDYDMSHQTSAPVMDPALVREVQAAALARKDALLRMAMEALQGCVPVTFSDATVSRRAAAIASIEAELSQSPAPVAPTFDEWWENHGKYNALFKFDHNASPSDRLASAKELMSLSWEVARESPAPVAVQPSQWQDIAGWKLVPIEPTEEMWTAGRDPIMYRDVKYQVLKSMEAPPWRINPETGKVELDQSKGTAAVHVWRAMIAAAPPLSASPEDKPK